MEDEKELDLRELFDIIKTRIWMIIVVTLLFTFTAAIVSVFFISPTYESSVGIIVGKQDGKEITGQDVTMYQNLMETYQNIASTNKVAQAAADKVGGGTTAKDLLERTKVTTKTGTMILNISVDSKTAAKSYKEVQAYADSFVARATELIPEGEVRIMDSAQLPESPVKPNVKMNIAIGFLLGLIVSAGIAFILEYMNNTIVTKEDVEKYLQLSVIGIIPENDLE
ncbi:MAG: capsular biosynthesis protein [Bacillota bacterium]|nr:capsular biosynthesis protein [Bacillota bacterium]